MGEGSYGKVYKYFNESEGIFYAVKEIDLEILKKRIENIETIIKREIKVLSEINHPNIVKYYGTITKGNKFNIVLEFCNGGSLLKLINSFKKFPEQLVHKYLTQILDGLEYLHSKNIIHRDIKAANILVNQYGECKLTDFGGAKILKEEFNMGNNTTSIQGTPNWMAPEVVKYGKSSRFSDIWSIGCTVIEMLTGMPPWWDKENQFEILNSICTATRHPKFPENISSDLKDFLEKCMQIISNKRANIYELKRHKFILNCNILNQEIIKEKDAGNVNETEVILNDNISEKNNNHLNDENFKIISEKNEESIRSSTNELQ